MCLLAEQSQKAWLPLSPPAEGSQGLKKLGVAWPLALKFCPKKLGVAWPLAPPNFLFLFFLKKKYIFFFTKKK
jgi:hypothetical protein